MSKVTISAPAKVNLVLEITGCDAQGFHLLDTIFQWLELADHLEIEEATQSQLCLINNTNSGLSLGLPQDNLVNKARLALEEKFARDLPCKCTLTKNIPAGGGLGGGSADAAATLIGLTKLFNLPIDREELLELAAKLGADVAFGLVGGTARGLERGQKLQALATPSELLDCSVVLTIPPYGLSTPLVYKEWDKIAPQTSVARGLGQKFAQKSPELDHVSLLANDLTVAALAIKPQLSEIFAVGEKFAAKTILCGSGSTVFSIVSKRRKDYSQVMDNISLALSRYGQVVVTNFSQEQRNL